VKRMHFGGGKASKVSYDGIFPGKLSCKALIPSNINYPQGVENKNRGVGAPEKQGSGISHPSDEDLSPGTPAGKRDRERPAALVVVHSSTLRRETVIICSAPG
jgi:hypothetical protein